MAKTKKDHKTVKNTWSPRGFDVTYFFTSDAPINRKLSTAEDVNQLFFEMRKKILDENLSLSRIDFQPYLNVLLNDRTKREMERLEQFDNLASYEEFLTQKTGLVPEEQAVDNIPALTIEKTYDQILNITKQYDKEHTKKEDKTAEGYNTYKRNVFETLLDELDEKNQKRTTKYQKLKNFANTLIAEDKKNILNKHQNETWKRYMKNVLSFLLVIPAIGRALHSKYKYDTFQFWLPESAQLERFTLKKSKTLNIIPDTKENQDSSKFSKNRTWFPGKKR